MQWQEKTSKNGASQDWNPFLLRKDSKTRASIILGYEMHLGFLIYIFTNKIWWIWMEPISRLSIWSTGRIPPVEETEIYMYCIHLLNPGPGCLSLLAKWFTSWGEGVGGNIYKSDWCGPDNWSNFDPRIHSLFQLVRLPHTDWDTHFSLSSVWKTQEN